MARLVHIALVALLVAACSPSTPTVAPSLPPGASIAPDVGGSQPPAASNGFGASSVPSSSPSVLTLAEAKEAYAVMARTSNRASHAVFRKYKNKPNTLKVGRQSWAEQAAIDARFIKDLQSVQWPLEVAGDIRALIRAVVVAQRTEVEASHARSLSQLYDLKAQVERQGQKWIDAASIVRNDLGLPPNA